MEHHIDQYLEPKINWEKAGLIMGNISEARNEMLKAILNTVYAISKTKEKREGDTWDRLLFRAVQEAYIDFVQPINMPHRDYEGFLLDDVQLRHFVDHFIESTRKFMPSFSECYLGMLSDPTYGTQVDIETEFLYWYVHNYQILYSNSKSVMEWGKKADKLKVA